MALFLVKNISTVFSLILVVLHSQGALIINQPDSAMGPKNTQIIKLNQCYRFKAHG